MSNKILQKNILNRITLSKIDQENRTKHREHIKRKSLCMKIHKTITNKTKISLKASQLNTKSTHCVEERKSFRNFIEMKTAMHLNMVLELASANSFSLSSIIRFSHFCVCMCLVIPLLRIFSRFQFSFIFYLGKRWRYWKDK